MPRSLPLIAADLLEQADSKEAEASLYRKTAHEILAAHAEANGGSTANGRSMANSGSVQSGVASSDRPAATKPARTGEAQRVLLEVFESRPGKSWTVPEVVAYAVQHGAAIKSKPAARATVGRMVDNGQLIKTSLGLYRLAASPSDVLGRQEIKRERATPGGNDLFRQDSSLNGATTETAVG